MDSYSVHYKFSQRFNLSAEKAFEWSMDYDEGDMAIMGLNATRIIDKINEDTLVLTDTYLTGKKPEVKRRLIRMYPEKLMMVNTRLSSKDQYSQFVYEFVAEGKNRSRLDFTGSHVFYGEKPPAVQLRRLAREMSEADAEIWKRLAPAMEKELAK